MTETEELFFFTENQDFFEDVKKTINEATKSIYLQTYIFSHDKVGTSIKSLLKKKALEGLDIRLLIDSWGSSADKVFFRDLVQAGANVRYFKRFREYLSSYIDYHKRNHRKLLLIDEKIVYLGSTNFEVRNWKESNIKFSHNLSLSKTCRTLFLRDFENYRGFKNYFSISRRYRKAFLRDSFELFPDVPSFRHTPSLNRLCKFVASAKKEVYIETPYFLPPRKLSKAFLHAAKKGVSLTIVLPEASDHLLVDILRRRFLSKLYDKENISLLFYKGKLHSKLMIADKSSLAFGSINLDYRSFYFQYELLCILKENYATFVETCYTQAADKLKDCIPVTAEALKHPNFFHKFLDKILYRLKSLF